MSGGTTDETAAGQAVRDALQGEEHVVQVEADESDAADLFANVGVDGPITFPEGDDQDLFDGVESPGDGSSPDEMPSFGSDERYETAHDAFKALASEVRAEGNDADVTADDLMLGDATAILDLEDMETVAFEDLTDDADGVDADDAPTFYLELDPDAGWNWRLDPDAVGNGAFTFGGDGAPAGDDTVGDDAVGDDAVAEDVLPTRERHIIDADGFDWSS